MVLCVWGLCVYPPPLRPPVLVAKWNHPDASHDCIIPASLLYIFLATWWLRYRDHSNQKISKSYHRGMSVIPFKWCMKTQLWGQEGSGGLVAHYSNFWRKVVLKCHTCIWQLPLGTKENECSAALSAVFEMGLTCSASLWLLEAPRAKGLWVDVTSISMYSCSWPKCRQRPGVSVLSLLRYTKCLPLNTHL